MSDTTVIGFSSIEVVRVRREQASDGSSFTLGRPTEISRQSVKVVRFQLTFPSRGIPQLVCWLAQSFTAFPMERGDGVELRVTVSRSKSHRADDYTLLGQEFVLFRGQVDDYGPGESSNGSVTAQFFATGELAGLHTGTVRHARQIPYTWRDLSQEGSAAIEDLSQSGLSKIRQPEDLLFSPLWAVLDACVRSIPDQLPADDLRTAPLDTLMDQLFGGLNIRARDTLRQTLIQPPSRFRERIIRTGVAEDGSTADIGTLVTNIYLALNAVLQQDWEQGSFLTRLGSIADAFSFALLETGGGHALVPWTPFGRASEHKTISGDEYVSSQPQRSAVDSVAGLVMVGQAMSTQAQLPPQPLGVHRRPVDTGLVIVQNAPPWLMYQEASGSAGLTATPVEDVLNDADADKPADGKPAENDSERARPAGNVEREIQQNLDPDLVGNTIARYAAWARNWAGSQLSVTCPFFRTDIAPLDRVRVEVAQAILRQGGARGVGGVFRQQTDFTSAYTYGSIDSVSITVDAVQGQASTTYNLIFAHSGTDQREIENVTQAGAHPVFEHAWAGATLHEDLSSRMAAFANIPGPPGPDGSEGSAET